MRTRIWLFPNILFLAFVFGALPFKMAEASSPREPCEITIYTLSVGSTNYLFGVALAELINKHSTWLRARAVYQRRLLGSWVLRKSLFIRGR
jgi:TRAP-type uncharacterized transport system substrate-binding protein